MTRKRGEIESCKLKEKEKKDGNTEFTEIGAQRTLRREIQDRGTHSVAGAPSKQERESQEMNTEVTEGPQRERRQQGTKRGLGEKKERLRGDHRGRRGRRRRAAATKELCTMSQSRYFGAQTARPSR